MKDVPSSIHFSGYSVLGGNILNSLSQYEATAAASTTNNNYSWSSYQELEDDIFEESFIGIQPLQSLLFEMVNISISISPCYFLNELFYIKYIQLNDDSFVEAFDAKQRQYLLSLVGNVTGMVSFLADEADFYAVELDKARSNATTIQQTLERALNTTPTILTGEQDLVMSLTDIADSIIERSESK